MRALSKSKLLAYRQCPKRIWLEIHRPDLRLDSQSTQASFDVGHQVGDIARQLYDPEGRGQLLDPQTEGFEAAFARTQALLTSDQPIFEASFLAEGALALADVLLPVRKAGEPAWRMVEVKSSTSVKPYHRDDLAVQSFVARKSGVPLAAVALAHIDSAWVYPGGGDYRGLLHEEDLTAEAFARTEEVQTWIAEVQAIVQQDAAPAMNTGRRCTEPYECGFLGYCRSLEPQVEYPIAWLPRIQSNALKAHIEQHRAADLRDIPDDLLNERQRRVKACTLAGETWFDAAGAAADLATLPLPAWFIDFETIQFAVPIWPGTRPYQQIPFQFSVHRLTRSGRLEHRAFLDLSGNDPTRAFAEALIDACGKRGPVYVYNAGFETARIRELGERYPDLASLLLAINKRVVDLLRVAEQCYYHPSQHGSWSIKQVLPAVAPDLPYDALDGVQDGGMAMDAYLEAIAPNTPADRKTQIEKQLLDYCGLDTYAMDRLWKFFAGSGDQEL
jgi:hypothetical protein